MPTLTAREMLSEGVALYLMYMVCSNFLPLFVDEYCNVQDVDGSRWKSLHENETKRHIPPILSKQFEQRSGPQASSGTPPQGKGSTYPDWETGGSRARTVLGAGDLL